MGRHIQPRCKLCRREKVKLYLKGDRCFSDKCAINKRPYPPGMHGKAPTRLSEYGVRLREKQKARRIYGITENQFRNYFEAASKFKGSTGEKFLELLERRLDNVVYRLGFAASRSEGRQYVRHGHFLVSGKKVDIPSFQVRSGQIISPKPKFKEKFSKILETLEDRNPPSWLSLDKDKIEGEVLSIPQRENIDTQIEEHLIVEFYSR